MELPGGLQISGEVRRGFDFKVVTGEIERTVTDASRASRERPARITAALAAALAHIGNETPTEERVHGLAVGDRQFLARRLSCELGIDALWLSAPCDACGAWFDFLVRQSELPVKPAGPGYPFAQADTSLGPYRLRVPTGADQEVVARLDNEGDGVTALVMRLVVHPQPVLASTSQLTRDDLETIEAALEAIAPEVAVEACPDCPACGAPNRVPVDPYAGLALGGDTLLEEIHRLASGYHWSEAEILALPRARRQRYLQLIDRSRSRVS